jgi:trypsin
MRLALVLAPALASLSTVAAAAPDGGPSSVLGGTNAKAGEWPDVAAILFPDASGDEALCTGTLVAPTVVLTAGHCYSDLDPPLPDNVLIGTSTLARPKDGEVIAIKKAYVFPDPDTT